MGAGKLLIIIGAVLTLLGTYVFAMWGIPTIVHGSGIGFIMNLGILFGNAPAIAAALSLDVWILYIIIILFLIFLASGVLQLVGLKSRAVGFIFSLFPLVIGIMMLLFFYTTVLGPITGFFTAFMGGPPTFPILVNMGALVGLGTYFLLGGGVLGIIGCFLPRD